MSMLIRGGERVAQRRVPKRYENFFVRCCTTTSLSSSSTSSSSSAAAAFVRDQELDASQHSSWKQHMQRRQDGSTRNRNVPIQDGTDFFSQKIGYPKSSHCYSLTSLDGNESSQQACVASSSLIEILSNDRMDRMSGSCNTTSNPQSDSHHNYGQMNLSADTVRTKSLLMIRSSLRRTEAYRSLGSVAFETLGLPLVSQSMSYYNDRTNPYQRQASMYFSSDATSANKDKKYIKGKNMNNFSTAAKIPTPQSSPKESSTIMSISNMDRQALLMGAWNITFSAIKAIVSFIIKSPYNTVYYLSHSKERAEKIAEIRAVVKKEFDHYWTGSKLLMADIRTARSLLARTLTGSTLTRRERKQLLRTVSDLFRLVPFSMFVLIPFMEFALPFALRLFPNMLPSTFQDSLKAEESMKRELQSRIAMAQFFQETLEELAKEQKRLAAKQKAKDDGDESESSIATKQEESAASMLEFLDRARRGEMMPPDAIIQYAHYFKDDLTLDNMPRMQLVNMCKYMSIPPYGADSFLRFQLRHRIRTLKEDDQRILWEGIDSLTKMELREACQERGMRSTGLSKEAYRRSLQQWLDLSVSKKVPISILIMSRTFFLQEEMLEITAPDDSKSVAGLADAISGLDKEVLNEVILNVATSEEQKSDPDVRKIKLEVVTQQNEKIRQEQAEREEAAAKLKESAEKSEAAIEESSTGGEEVVAAPIEDTKSTEMSIVEPEPIIDSVEQVSDGVTTAEDVAVSEEEKRQELDDESNLSTEEMDAISQLLSADPVSKERAELEKIKSAMTEDDDGEKLPIEEVASDEATPEVDAGDDVLGEVTQDEDEIESDDMLVAAKTIERMEKDAAAEADKSTTFSSEDPRSTPSHEEEIDDITSDAQEEPVDPVVARLKKRVESMVDKIEVQLSDVQVKIGDKLHFLDKDNDGILSREEMAECLQQVLKREITFDEAMEIASQMDENEDGLFTVQELINWIETNRLVKFEKEGRDADMDRIMESQSTDSDPVEPPVQAENTASNKM